MQQRTDPKELGRRGEARTATWYATKGYRVVEQNWRCEFGEIDIIACDDTVLVFCEVKSRASNRWGTPAEAVTWAKQQRLRRLAAAWLASETLRRPRIRFDVASFVHGDLSIIEGAF